MLLWERRCESRREYIQFPLLFLSEFLSRRFQCDASSVGVLSVYFSTGSPSLWLGYHPRLRMVRLRRRREFLCVVVGAEVGEQGRVYTVSTFIFLSEFLSVHFSTGSPSLWLGYHPRLSMVRLRRRRELLCVAVGVERM